MLNKKLLFYILLICCLTAKSWAQYDIPDKPTKQKGVYQIGTTLLSAGQEQALSHKLETYADTTSTQIVVLIIPTTKGEDITLLGAKWGQKWGIGQADKDNGILITLAVDDRQVDINTGYGIETVVTDRMTEQILNRVMLPQFKTGNYYAGLDYGTTALIQALAGTYDGEPTTTTGTDISALIPFIIFFIIVLIILSRSRNNGGGNNNQNGGRRSGAGSLLDVIILSNMGRGSWGSGGGFGGSSGGGFGGGGFGGGFGGGGFGGGGASGGW